MAQGLRAAGGWTLHGVDTAAPARAAAEAFGVFHALTMPETLGSEDVIVLAMPTAAAAAVLPTLAPALAAGATVTDVASVKGPLAEALGVLPPALRRQVVLGHPIAGSERSGMAASDGALFQGRRVVLTPQADTAPEALAKVEQIWSALGAEIETLTVEVHDAVLARTSHLPHLLAFALVDALGADPHREAIFRLVAGGFRDFTRIAGSDPTMWSQIFTTNGPALLEALDRFEATLRTFRGAIAAEDGAALLEAIARARATRDAALMESFGGTDDAP
ncbi:MAG: prephenate dehydrogenase/arogenate dehydrogenase family protein [Pseudomonadales bacterium]|nr:prephenate dehydrogenase/arogenate dehydrogenase family protein [Pseudomonadales bacterium]